MRFPPRPSLTYKSFYYDILYDAVNQLFLQFNPCRMDKRGKCIRTRHLEPDDKVQRQKAKNFAGCCHISCKYLTKTGCSTRSLGCKLYYCYAVEKKYPKLAKEMRRLEKWSFMFGLPWNVYRSKEESFLAMEVWRG